MMQLFLILTSALISCWLPVLTTARVKWTAKNISPTGLSRILTLKIPSYRSARIFLYYATQSYNDLTCSYPAIPQIRTIFDFICTNIRLYNNICNYYHTLSKYKPHKVDTDSHSIDAVIFTALTMLYEHYTQYQYLLAFYIVSFFLFQKDW